MRNDHSTCEMNTRVPVQKVKEMKCLQICFHSEKIMKIERTDMPFQIVHPTLHILLEQF